MRSSQVAILVTVLSTQAIAKSTLITTTSKAAATTVPTSPQRDGVYQVSVADDGNKSIERLGGMTNFTAPSNSAKFRRGLHPRDDGPDHNVLECAGPGAGSYNVEDAWDAAQALGSLCDSNVGDGSKPWVNKRGYTYGIKNGIQVYFCNYSKQKAFCYSDEMSRDLTDITNKCNTAPGYTFHPAGAHNLDISYGIALEKDIICPTLAREGYEA